VADGYRYLKLSEPTLGTWPDDLNIEPGSIIRLPMADPVPSGPCAWNEKTKEWVCAVWIETTDPRLTPASPVSGVENE
jgi:hypothetical protein